MHHKSFVKNVIKLLNRSFKLAYVVVHFKRHLLKKVLGFRIHIIVPPKRLRPKHGARTLNIRASICAGL